MIHFTLFSTQQFFVILSEICINMQHSWDDLNQTLNYPLNVKVDFTIFSPISWRVIVGFTPLSVSWLVSPLFHPKLLVDSSHPKNIVESSHSNPTTHHFCVSNVIFCGVSHVRIRPWIHPKSFQIISDYKWSYQMTIRVSPQFSPQFLPQFLYCEYPILYPNLADIRGLVTIFVLFVFEFGQGLSAVGATVLTRGNSTHVAAVQATDLRRFTEISMGISQWSCHGNDGIWWDFTNAHGFDD